METIGTIKVHGAFGLKLCCGMGSGRTAAGQELVEPGPYSVYDLYKGSCTHYPRLWPSCSPYKGT